MPMSQLLVLLLIIALSGMYYNVSSTGKLTFEEMHPFMEHLLNAMCCLGQTDSQLEVLEVNIHF